MGEGLVRILDGATFAVSQGTGDIEPDPAEPTGLFSLDTRFISKWVLTVDGRRLNALSYDAKQYFESRFFLVPGPHTTYTDAQISVVRKRSVGGALVEELVILNHADHAVELRLRMDIEADFADIFQVKDRRIEKMGEFYNEVEEDGLRLGYRRDNFARETRITVSGPAVFDREGFTMRLRLEPHAKTDLKIHVDPRAVMPGRRGLRMALPGQGRERDLHEDLDEWVERAPKLNAEWGALNRIYQRCLVDLAALRFSPLALGNSVLPAAGLPWFMTMFGRDSIFTCLQTLPFAPHLSQTTLRILAALQGTRFDDFRDEDPGRILHEMRYGESAAFEEQPHSPYYGSVDATPLFVILLDEYERWSGDSALVQELEAPARAALNWIEKYADLVGDGYIWYSSRNDRTGLHNQCWKDSGDAISYRDGRLPGFPRATCELQGYAYDARIRGARLARTFWRDEVLAAPPGARRRRAQGALQPGVVGGRGGVLRPRPGGGRPTGRRVDVQHRPPALERDRRAGAGRQGRRASARAAAVHRLGRAHLRQRAGPLQPGRLSHRHRLALRQLVHRLGTAPVRLPRGGRHAGRGDTAGSRVLRGPAAGGVRRLWALADQRAGALSDGVQPAGLVDRSAAADAAGAARTGAAGRPARGEPGHSGTYGTDGAARHSRPLGADGRLRARPDAPARAAVLTGSGDRGPGRA